MIRLQCIVLIGAFLLLTPSGLNAQSGGLIVGWMHGIDNRISQYDASSSSTATFVAPGWFVGGYYAVKDSGRHFRLEAGWEHQMWEQRFTDKTLGTTQWYTTEQRSGTMSKRLDLVRATPQVILPLGKRVNAILGMELAMVFAARTTEKAVLTRVGYQPPGPHPSGGTSVFPSDTTYSGTAFINEYQWAARLGLEIKVADGWGVLVCGSMGTTSFVRPIPGYRSGASTPVNLQLLVSKRLFR